MRGPGSNRDNSPNISPGPRMESRFSRPSPDEVPNFNFPSTTTNKRSPASPSLKRVWPLLTFTWVIDSRKVAAAASSSAVNSGARRITSSSFFCAIAVRIPAGAHLTPIGLTLIRCERVWQIKRYVPARCIGC